MVSSINGTTVPLSIFTSRKTSRKPSDKFFLRNENEEAIYNIFLNKSFSKDIVDYAHTLYTTIVDLKDSSKELEYFVDEYKTVEDKIETLDDSRKEKVNNMFQEKMEQFIDDYDTAFEFANNQQHSKLLLDFSSELFEITGEYGTTLEEVGISESEQGKLYIDLLDSDITDKNKAVNKLEGIKSFVNEVYNSTQNILSRPMSEHMNFKNLNYYYNYGLDRYQSNTFRLIEAGMIVDIAL